MIPATAASSPDPSADFWLARTVSDIRAVLGIDLARISILRDPSSGDTSIVLVLEALGLPHNQARVARILPAHVPRHAASSVSVRVFPRSEFETKRHSRFGFWARLAQEEGVLWSRIS